MKRYFLITALMLLVVLSNAQISTKQLPRSFFLKEKVGLVTKTLSSPDIDALLEEDDNNANFFKAQRCAVAVPMFENFFDNAVRTSFENYDLYTLKVTIPYAYAIGFSSNDFYLPKGTELYLYNPEHSKVLGAYTSDNNAENGIFATEYVYGDEIIIEYYQPKTIIESAKIELSEFVYFYRDVTYIEQEQMLKSEPQFSTKEFRESGSCNVNINCSEGDNYQDVKNAVMRIQIRGGYNYYWCTGTLINTTNYSKEPYIISAAHCVQYSSTSNYSYFVFYFNYEAPGCTTPSYGSEPSYVSYTGCTFLAKDSSNGDNGTDYLLVKLNNNFTSSHNPYFAGWLRSSTAPNSGVCIHHPSGDIKKISSFTAQPTSAEAYNSTHWRVYWAQTTNGFGIVEGGSSGSGLFNTDGRLVGTLTGGYSDCGYISSPSMEKDWYGRFDLQFSNLSQWLDATGTGATTVEGIYFNQAVDTLSTDTIPSAINTIEASMGFVVYPSIANDYINISSNIANTNVVVVVLNEIGQSVLSYTIPANQSNTSINISSLKDGVYFVRFYANGNSYIQKIIKQ
ncbi:MAG: T9SS type A sorting domain-containing protein [Bacteroidota bacterium]|nr:T9SS type A sorting domain-containing protein [Bacteroidota bacterium]